MSGVDPRVKAAAKAMQAKHAALPEDVQNYWSAQARAALAAADAVSGGEDRPEKLRRLAGSAEPGLAERVSRGGDRCPDCGGSGHGRHEVKRAPEPIPYPYDVSGVGEDRERLDRSTKTMARAVDALLEWERRHEALEVERDRLREALAQEQRENDDLSDEIAELRAAEDRDDPCEQRILAATAKADWLVGEVKRERDEAEYQRDRLREDLRRYGRHYKTCPAGEGCTCGLRAALAGSVSDKDRSAKCPECPKTADTCWLPPEMCKHPARSVSDNPKEKP